MLKSPIFNNKIMKIIKDARELKQGDLSPSGLIIAHDRHAHKRGTLPKTPSSITRNSTSITIPSL